MRAGYVALLSLVVGFSAYRGTGSVNSDSPQQQPAATRGSGSGGLGAGDEPFPTLGAGLCRLTLDTDSTAPCRECRAICPARALAGLIQDHFRAELGSDQEFLARHWNVPQAEQVNLKFVIASLPDPVHTHMALLFDRGIETIQSAAQAGGYLFARAWMPWDISTHSESSDFTARLAQAEFRYEVESLPGLMF